MSTFIPPTPAAHKSAEQHEEPSEQDSFNHLLFKVLRLTSEQVQDLNDWMKHQGIPNVHEVIAQNFRKPHALEDDLQFIREDKPCHIQSNVMISLSLMITYIKHLRYSAKTKYFGPFYYIQIDPQDYDEWRTTPPEEEVHFQTPSKLGSPATPRSMATSVASESYITLSNFKKGIKRDASAYPIFKNERYYNTFIRHFKATAKAQGLNSLMDPNFTPGSDEYEQQLFQDQQDFLYSVLISSLKTDFSEALVKDHEGDAQLIIELLHEHHTGNSQYSRSEINRITKYLTNIKLDDTWRGTNESFLMHYNDQLRLLDSLVDSDEKLPDNTRVTFLESAVESVPDLRRVKITDNVLQAQLDSTRPITYRSYFDLLKDAAFHLDQATKRGSKIRRTNVHFSGPNNEDDHQNLTSDDHQVIQQEDVCNEPPEPLSYSVFQSHFQGSSTSSTQKIFLPKPIWEKLSKDQQQMIIDHNRSLPKSGSSSISTPNKSPSPLPHKPTPQQTAKSQQVHTHQSDESTADTTKIETTPSDPLLAMVHQSIHTSNDDASDITKVLSAKRSRQIQVCKHYIFQHANHTNNQLVDHGANGGLAGSDMRVIYKTHRKINISGIDNHEVNGLDVVTAATLLNTSLGKVIGIFNEYAHLGKGSSIHSSGQLEWFKTHVDEKSIKVGGTQLITTLEGYSVPLLIKDGLAYATSLGRPTDQDMDTYPHVFFTSPDEWDPSVLDHDPPPLDGLDPSQVLDQPFGDPMFDAYGDFNERIIANLNIHLDAPPEDYGSYIANLHQGSSQEPDWNALRPFFAWTSPSSIQDTFNVTTRHGSAPHTQDYIKKHFKSRNPVFNIPRCSEAVATDTIFSDTPAVDDGSTMAQFFCGRDTLVCDAYGIKSTKQFINTLSDNIRKRGAMDTLISDGGKYEISKRVTDLLRSLFIQDYQSEPYHQHQNKAENRFGLAKRYTNTVMNTSGCPAFCWLLCLQYICVVLNHLASPTLQGICPVQALEGTTPDISFLLHFSFYEPVYYRIDSSEPDLNFPSSSNEKKGYWVGFADNQGDSLTWRILTEDTQKIIIRSGVRSALRTTTNQRLASPSGEGTTLPFPIPYSQSQNSLPLDPLDASTPNFEHFVKSQTGEDEDNPIPMANIDIPNLLGRSFLLPPEDNGERHMAKVIDIDDHGQTLEDLIFKLKINKDQAEEIMSYNQLMDYIQKGTDAEEDPDSLFKFRDIVAHQGPLESTDPNHKGSKYNVMVEWESGEVTYEPLTLISKDDPITCAVYAKKHDLLDTTGWKHLKRYAKTSKRLIRAVKQSRIRQVRASVRYQHGFQVPKDYNDAMRLDKENGNTHWQDAMDLELTQIHEYKVFKDTGKAKFHNGKVVTPDGFQKIRVHFAYAVKHDGRFKARLVADGHLTKEPVESIYSGVVSLRSLRMVVFLSQLNNLEIWGADVGNAYLEAYTDEKLCIMAGPELKELQGHLLIMVKALYGTRSGGARWHDRLFDILQEMKFKPSKADPDVWMRPEPGGTCYEYIAVYVDDLAIAAKDSQAFCNELKKKYNLKLKGVGPLDYHLGCTYKKDPDGTLAADPRRYVNKILESFERMFKEKPRKSRPPLEGGDHPELDTSELCDEHQTKQFQTLIGQLQWLISLGRFDIAVHVMSLSRFRAQPRKGHLDRAKRIIGYLLFLPDGAIRFRTGEPDFSSLKDQEYDWTRTVYSGACEQIPHDIPKHLGKHVQTTHYVDANLHHDLATGKAVTAALHFLNQTPIDAYTKRQSTVETATYGSEFVAARTAVDQIIDIRTTLIYLGVPIRDKSYMFGDNKSVVTSSTIPNSTISKRHHLASYHRVREAIAAKFISFHWKDGKSNPADILSKHWEFATVWPMLKPILFWRGETATQLKGSDRIPSTTPAAEPPRDAKDSGSARSHSTHLETSSSTDPKRSPTQSVTRYQDQISVRCTRWTLRMPSFTRAPHAQPSLSNFTRRDSDFGEPTRSRGTTRLEQNFPTSPQNKKTKLTHRSLYMSLRTILTPHVN